MAPTNVGSRHVGGGCASSRRCVPPARPSPTCAIGRSPAPGPRARAWVAGDGSQHPSPVAPHARNQGANRGVGIGESAGRPGHTVPRAARGDRRFPRQRRSPHASERPSTPARPYGSAGTEAGGSRLRPGRHARSGGTDEVWRPVRVSFLLAYIGKVRCPSGPSPVLPPTVHGFWMAESEAGPGRSGTRHAEGGASVRVGAGRRRPASSPVDTRPAVASVSAGAGRRTTLLDIRSSKCSPRIYREGVAAERSAALLPDSARAGAVERSAVARPQRRVRVEGMGGQLTFQARTARKRVDRSGTGRRGIPSRGYSTRTSWDVWRSVAAHASERPHPPPGQPGQKVARATGRPGRAGAGRRPTPRGLPFE